MVSLLCELIGVIRLSAASVLAPYWDPSKGLKQRHFWRKNFEDGNCLLQPPVLLLISYVKPIEKYLVVEPQTRTKC
jgi:hypothetical protein